MPRHSFSSMAAMMAERFQLSPRIRYGNKTGGTRSTGQRPAHPCLNCSKPHKHNNSFCSGPCCEMWRVLHPHNGKKPMILGKRQVGWLNAHKVAGGLLRPLWELPKQLAVPRLYVGILLSRQAWGWLGSHKIRRGRYNLTGCPYVQVTKCVHEGTEVLV